MVLTIERLPKRLRQQQLLQAIDANPFMTDEELMRTFGVSIQTVRLDRLELGIPELRERMKHMAVKTYDHVRSLPIDEIIGEVIDLQLDQSGISIFEIKEDHIFSRTKIARGHHIFSQANSLAVAVIDDPIALTASADIRFIRSVKLGEKCVAKAYVRSVSKGKARVEVFTYVGDETVFRGNFVIFHSKKEQHLDREDKHHADRD
ncbi:transcription factor FapR [Paenibacillus roseipurpureus]|uniref:transcription factor FapR n=1 Tax=Paenibacillus roseopurpureus TaxID=2918901 RepID=UPI0037C7210C